jgi:dTDP-4-amino-4,6-dideoxygalactose transaminase
LIPCVRMAQDTIPQRDGVSVRGGETLARHIPFNRASLVGREFEYLRDAMRNMHLSGDGPFTKRCQVYIEQLLGTERAILTTSCTHALEMAALLLDIRPGDEVLVPSFTFVSTINAFVLRGARPIFMDIRADTLNLDETQVERAITSRTRAIIAVHYAGIGCEMDVICDIGNRHGIPVVEDNAHGLCGTYKGRNLGTFGCLATQSFHETKNVTCGEGGALLVNDPQYIERAEIIREKGTDRSRFFRGQVDKYTWVALGSSYLPSDLLAAFLYAQLEELPRIQTQRKQVWERYADALQPWADDNGIRLPVVPGYCEQPYHMFYVLTPNLEWRQRLLTYLNQRGVTAVFHYQPLHLSEMGQGFGGAPGDCPVTEDVSDRLVRLPFFNDLAMDEQQYVIDAVTNFPG